MRRVIEQVEWKRSKMRLVVPERDHCEDGRMPHGWKEDFFEKLVEASHASGDARLATATQHPRKKTASYEHPQLRWLECVFDSNRTSGN